MPETKKYCTPLHKEAIVPLPNPEEALSITGLPGLPNDGPEFEDGSEFPGWEDRSKYSDGPDEEGFSGTDGPIETCETNPKSIGCKVLGDQFIYAIQGLITDLESTKPPGYILAVGKLKGAIIKLQDGN